jgi:hypothetical protein
VKTRSFRTYSRSVLLIITTFISLTTTIPVFAGGSLSPRDTMLNYYSEINQGHYQLAYQQWLQPSQTYDEFVNGYSNTSHVDAYFGGFRADYTADPKTEIDVLHGQIPGVLVGTHLDGTTVVYSGCYTLIYDGLLPTRWKIGDGKFLQVSGIPKADNIQYWLEQADCLGYKALNTTASPQIALVDYYDKVNAKLLDEAYASWTTPWQSLTDFKAGYADTTEVVPFIGQICGNGPAPYIHIVLFGYHTDGSMVVYGGSVAVAADATKPKSWGITGATLSEIDLSNMSNLPNPSIFTAIINSLTGPC